MKFNGTESSSALDTFRPFFSNFLQKETIFGYLFPEQKKKANS